MHASQPEARLRIAHVVRSDAFAGVERYVCEVANGLSRLGHHINVIGGDPDRMKQELQSEVAFSAAASTAGVARRLATLERVDLVHAHMTAAELAAVILHPRNRVPVVATRHFAIQRGANGSTGAITRWLSRAIATQIAISEFVAAGIGEKATVLYNGVANRAAAALEAPTVLMMQRLQPEKSPEVGIRAWSMSRLGERGWTLKIAGSGTLSDQLRSEASELGVGSSVEFLGRVRDTVALLDTTSVLLATAPSEPFGLTVAEAMAHGIPVVATGGGAHPEVLGSSEFLFGPDDTSAAAEHLVRLADDQDLRRREGARLRSRQQKLFSLDGHLARLEEIYRSTLAERSRRHKTGVRTSERAA